MDASGGSDRRKALAIFYVCLGVLVVLGTTVVFAVGSGHEAERSIAGRYQPEITSYCLGRTFDLRQSGEFDAAHYLHESWDVRATGRDPVIHYLEAGAAEGRDPSAHFSTAGYLRRNPDVARVGANPLFHYLRHGRSEGRAAPTIELKSALINDHGAPAPADPYAVRPDDVVKDEAQRGAAAKRLALGRVHLFENSTCACPRVVERFSPPAGC